MHIIMNLKTRSRHQSRAQRRTLRMHQSRAQRRTKKGGMFRGSASAIGKKVLKEALFGKNPVDKLDKANQLKTAIEKGMTRSRASEFKPAELSQQFRASESPFYEMHRHSSHDRAYNAAIHKTPTRHTPNDEAPKLGSRLRHRETDEERRRRLGMSVAPAMHNPGNIVKELFTL